MGPRIFADRGVGTGSRLHGQNALRVDEAAAAHPFRILLGDKVVGHHGKLDAVRLEARDETFQERGLAGPDRAADADAGRSGSGRLGTHRSIYR